MRKFLNEFKEFALKGSVIDLAVGMIIGSAFTGIVTSLTDNFINPILNLVTRAHPALYTGEEIMGYISAFITAVINFVIVALVLFLILRSVNRLEKLKEKALKKKDEEPAAPTTKICKFCKSEISIDATRCPHCTSQLDE